ncbi:MULTISPECIES: single-stranded-DNA-specific exonuclease RecJ [Marinobacter]|jgi:single-stranded-DNA-specific exonuclease|uniref:single-stranded-DNA-specific exonuclease RecJ n=1 Tax=Marinobacter TaxID=2742 RepID=UPI0009491A7A|nr:MULTISPECIES: single-stranded-DNA-specific exonuclease RecJ [Marinobacter]MCZ4284859.1 single-stranded-DNA-specific exonuclease RecJ [Marinobacter salarius]MDC8455113.1 single-stranded-DNA-specific exonuclease RecJ [Marinobacter sp. DS40M6]MDM8179883.1 single-stranded-DNA-specific exonuclease RecJ [Marinobacter salarius]OLF83212.1 single-stranded-DNA-specific exonuclease RecJ [Marinobacter sp. C18]RUT73861.1 single-stranded-DNA-specific exonuclease RecJ [Marinobacter sp. NP-6]|tara:strand:- start:28 stop:1761 length:1734 start_codon:yes stop_codon:yes gene_type:complete
MTPKKILRRPSPDTTPDWGQNLPPLLRRLYAARGVTSDDQLTYTLKHLASPMDLRGVDRAVALLADAITSQQRVLVLGDFDADGATSTAVAMLGLGMLGLNDIDFRVPSRFSDGYGLTPGIIHRLRDEGALPDLLVTVDNGISAVEGVRAARELGIRVVVTDHHLAGETLPEADAIVNPNQPGCPFLSKNAAGVGVMFYVLTALRKHLREQGLLPEPQPNLGNLLDLVALGTVADVVPLDHNNRIFVEQGLRRIRQGEARPGILALLEVAGRDHSEISSTDLGFVVGPRLNAAGRLDDMSVGIACLLADSRDEAQRLARELDTFNRERRTIEKDMKTQAQDLLASMSLDIEGLPWGLALFDTDWHQGVIGILAARIREQTHRPTIAFAPDDNGEDIKGSARSIPGLHIRDVLAVVDARHPGMMKKFGGHAMAAGMTLSRGDLDAFSDAFDRAVRDTLRAEDLEAAITTDGPLSPDELHLETATLLKRAGPWGQHFPEPLFDGNFRVVSQRIVGENHLKLVLQPEEGGAIIDGIAFNTGPEVPDYTRTGARVVYKPDANTFRGRTNLQLLVDYLEPLA